jgi:hypothetical protein
VHARAPRQLDRATQTGSALAGFRGAYSAGGSLLATSFFQETGAQQTKRQLRSRLSGLRAPKHGGSVCQVLLVSRSFVVMSVEGGFTSMHEMRSVHVVAKQGPNIP